MGGYAACGIREADSTLGCWCCPAEGAYGLCDDVPAGAFVDVSVGSAYACATDQDGMLTCWGAPPGWLRHLPPAGPVLDVDVESSSGCAVMLDGSLECFGNGLNWGEPAPQGVAFVEVGVGRNSACGREADGTLHCWGRDTYGDPFPNPPAGSFATLEAYSVMACALDAGGNPSCWWASVQEPFVVPEEQFRQITLGEWDACGVTLDGRALCWGRDDLGETIVPRLGR